MSTGSLKIIIKSIVVLVLAALLAGLLYWLFAVSRWDWLEKYYPLLIKGLWLTLVLVACAALHIYSPAAAEVRSLAVEPGWKEHGLGRQLLNALEEEAREFGLKTLFAFTYVDGFFRKLGYEVVDRGELPLKAWKKNRALQM